jgi:voltage-gated potassium channel Kch
VIAVLADRDKVEMEDELRSKVRGLRGTRVVCRSGSPSDPDDLALVRPETARSVIVLSPDVHAEDRVEGFDPDAEVIKTLLALRSIDPHGSSHRVVAEVRHPASVDAARLIGRDRPGTTSVVDIREMVAKLMVQTSRESGAAAVYRELFDYASDEIYFLMHHGLGDVTYADAVVAFEHLTVLGVISPYGATQLNPMPETRVGDLGLIVLGENESILATAARSEAQPRDDAFSYVVPEADRPTHTVLIGWNDRAPLIVRELGTYAAPGSTLTVVTAYGDPGVPEVEGMTVTVVKAQTTQRSVLEEHVRSGLDHVMVLCYSDHLPAEAADSLTLITLVHVRDILRKVQSGTPVVSELIDDRNRVLAQIANIDDVVVSGEIVSLVITQLSADSRIEPVLDELLGAEGTDIYIRPAEWYVVPYREVTWSTFVASASRRAETAIGYASPSFAKPGSRVGVALNPAKSETVVVGSGDRVVVLAKH